MEILLRLKHWQIFLMTFGLALVAACYIFFFSDTFHSPFIFRIVSLLTTIGFVIASCWLYMVGTEFNKRVPAVQMNSTSMFRNCLYYVVAINILTNIILPATDFRNETILWPLTLISLGCNIYANYFAARALTTAEHQRSLTFGDFAGDFFGFIFYPIGIWFLQPRINRMIDNELAPIDPDAPLDQGIR